MKIYPSNHYFAEEDRIKPGDIPLSCLVIDAQEKDYKIDSLIAQSSNTRIESVLPYDEFDMPDPYLFDREMRRVEVTTKMIRTDNGYAFFPPNATEFYPSMFDYRAVIQNQGTYKSNVNYDITVGCIEPDYELSNNLVKIFGNSYETGLAPSNIIINNGEIKSQAFSNMAIADCDFLFIYSHDGVHHKGSTQVIDLEYYLEENINVWIVVDELEDYRYENDMAGTTELVTNAKAINMDGTFVVGHEMLYANYNTLPGFLDSNYYEKVKTSSMDCETSIIAERNGKGFVIITNLSLVQAWDEKVSRNIIYETMMETYLRKYEKTRWFTSWITDENVDYLPRQESVFGRKHEIIKVQNLISEDSPLKHSDSMRVIDVEVRGDASLKSVSPDYEIFFIKTGGKVDPPKNTGARSYYTTRNSVISYESESVNRVETPLDIRVESTSKGDYLKVKEFKSTSLKMDTLIEQEVRIPDSIGLFYVCVKGNMINMVISKMYDEEVNGIKIATVESKLSVVIKNYDARKMGGGLPEEVKDIYNLLDIGHIKGKPHRKGGYVVVRLPGRMRANHDLIENALSKHVIGGDLCLIVYDEE